MKFTDKEIINIDLVKENVIYVFGGNKKFWLCFYEDNNFWSYNNDRKVKLQRNTISLLKETEFNKDQFKEASLKYTKGWYTSFKNNILQHRTQYTGAVLTDQSRVKLISELSSLIPNNWKVIAHHMTMCLGDLPEDNQHLIGTKHTLHAKFYSIDYDKGVMAIGVDSELNSTSNFKHITIALGENASPVMSNDLTEFKDITLSPIEAVVSKVLKNGNVSCET